MKDASTPFRGAHARSYAEGPPRQVPGFGGLHRMMSLLLAERVPSGGRVLVLGAGGGLELRTLAADHPSWTFDGVDPSADMLDTARLTAAPFMDRIALAEGTIDAAPEGPFDGATCLLTFHFISRDDRLATLRALHRRLRPGAPFVIVHLSVPREEPHRSLWIDRHIAFGGGKSPDAIAARNAMLTRLTILSPDEDEAMLAQAGFSGTSLFYAGFSCRGWVAYA